MKELQEKNCNLKKKVSVILMSIHLNAVNFKDVVGMLFYFFLYL